MPSRCALHQNETTDGHSMAKKSKTIVDQLRQAIRESGMTSYALGKAAGIGQPIIDRFIGKERMPRLDTAAKLAAVLGLELTKKRDS